MNRIPKDKSPGRDKDNKTRVKERKIEMKSIITLMEQRIIWILLQRISAIGERFLKILAVISLVSTSSLRNDWNLRENKETLQEIRNINERN